MSADAFYRHGIAPSRKGWTDWLFGTSASPGADDGPGPVPTFEEACAQSEVLQQINAEIAEIMVRLSASTSADERRDLREQIARLNRRADDVETFILKKLAMWGRSAA